ncbi:MAG: MATE family efflux transporter, partial [Clostridia bacterium]
VALMGIFIKLQSFIFMPIFGICNSVVPIVSYNFGAQKYDRINKALVMGLIMAAVISSLGFIIVESMPQYILMLFDASANMMDMGKVALRIVGVSYFLPFFSIVCSSYFQALGRSISSLVISISRQLVILLPVAYLLSLTGNVAAVWWALPIAEIACVGMSFVILILCQRKLKRLQSQQLLSIENKQ